MKGDFSFLSFDTEPHYSGVLHQQGRVLLDRDWNEAAAIAANWRAAIGRDAFGEGILAVPASEPAGFKVLSATTDGSVVQVELDAGRAWADGLALMLDASITLDATYFAPPFQTPEASPATIADGVRDLVVLDVWEDTVNGFQDPTNLIEPALGGPDTTERTQSFASVKLLRLGPNDDCSAAAGLADDFDAKGKLTVSPAPVLTITGDCPLEAGGGTTSLEHYLYRIEIADPDGAGQARFKWSKWNGGLVGRGVFAAGAPGTGTVTITANDQAINHCDETDFYLEAIAFDATIGSWSIVSTADATLSQDGVLSLTNVDGAWPATAPKSAFFRLWNAIRAVADFPSGGTNPVELNDGIRLEFDPASAGNANYQVGDYWTFPVRAAGAVFDPPVWPTNAPPQGVHHHRVALGILDWSGAGSQTLTAEAGDIDDCRRVFRPLTNQKVCCTFIVGDGRTSHGDFESIEEALKALPSTGGEICLLPGLHQTNAVISGLINVKIKGCDTKTKVIPREKDSTQPIFTIQDSQNVCLEHMDLITLGGTAIEVDASTSTGGIDVEIAASRALGNVDIEIAHNRILACTNAIHARNTSGANIHHNRIQMLDTSGGGVAIYLAGNDGIIERNDVRLLPASSTPPIDVPGDGNPVQPTDPCAELQIVYVNPLLFTKYVNLIWTLELLPFLVLPEPYLSLGGIQLEGGSERVRVLENTIIGGAGNGITLGASLPPPQLETIEEFVLPKEAAVNGLVSGPDAKPMAGAQITLTDAATGVANSYTTDVQGRFQFGHNPATFRVSEGVPGFAIDKVDLRSIPSNASFSLTITLKPDDAPAPEGSGFLYDIAIERNRIEAMGLSGIGVVLVAPPPPPGPVFLLANVQLAGKSQLGAPVVGLAIRGNQIRGCLLNSFDNELRAIASSQGLGGISLGLCEGLVIVDNDVEKNGVSGANPVCGIFVASGGDVEIARNRLIDNGPLTPNVTTSDVIAGWRGGIVLKLVTSFSLLTLSATEQGDTFSQRPAARIHENLVDQPVGLALYAVAFGPVQCNDNAFTSNLSGVSALERLAGTVFLFDLGGIQNAGPGIKLASTDTIEPNAIASSPHVSEPGATPASSSGFSAPILDRDSAVLQLFPSGNVMFNDNQLRTGESNTSLTCQTVATLDDLSYADNQSFSLRTGSLFTNGLLAGNTLRAIGNRFVERGAATMLSLWTLSSRLNNTSFNQGDHCIVASDTNPAMPAFKSGNQVLNPGALCASRSIVATLLFRPHP